MSEQSEHKAVQSRRRAEREARRKAELKANMARRKAQLRGRAVADDTTMGAEPPEDTQE